jgi:hypothetical protein
MYSIENGGFPTTIQEFIANSADLLTQMCRVRNPIVFFVANVEKYHTKFSNTFMSCVKQHKTDEEWILFILHVHDLDFKNSIIPLDATPILCSMSRHFPSFLGDSTKASSDMVVQPLFPWQIYESEKWKIEGDSLLLDGDCVGFAVEFEAFCKSLGITMKSYIHKRTKQKFSIPNHTLWAMKKDIYCSKRKRTVLYANSGYGSNVYISSFVYKISKMRIGNIFSWIGPNSRESLTFPADFGTRRVKGIIGTKPALEILFCEESVSILIDNAHLTSGKQASILYYILDEYQKTKRTIFEHKEFTKDERFISSLHNPGFVPRLNKVRALLTKAKCGIVIKNKGKGKIELVVNKPYTLQVVDK